jgi:trans-L-3-hydroxyproline dehydratase
VRDFVDAASALTERVKTELALSHPDSADLAFLYGTILTDGGDAFSEKPTNNICVFADAEVDRSPTGSGVTARLAAMHARGQIGLGQTRQFESIAGSRFSGSVASMTKAGDFSAITARVGGRAYYSGRAEFTVEEDDALGRGFLLR